MKKHLFILGFICIFKTVFAQKVINNPDCISQNIGSITKVELTDKETIIHFHVRSSLGSWMSIPGTTYIEESFSKEAKRLYVKKAEGIPLHKRYTFENSDEVRYKLYFPPLPKDIKKINYGEANPGGNWFIYKLDLTKNGKDFISNKNKEGINNNLKKLIESDLYNQIKEVSIKINKNIKAGLQNNSDLDTNTILPKDLPEDFFGNWYDKHGTLLMITTPDYLVSDKRIKYYLDIQKIGTNKYKIRTSANTFEVLSLEDKTMTIRTNRLLTLTKKSGFKKVPNFIKGKWLHWENIKEITITDEYFYNNDKDYHGVYRDIVKNKIDYIAKSNNGDLIWFILYNNGNYTIYFVEKKDGEYILQPRGYAQAKYKKMDN